MRSFIIFVGILVVLSVICVAFVQNVAFFTKISSIATALAFLMAASALWWNYKIYKDRIAFDSLIKLCEIFHVELREDRDKVVKVKIEDDRALNDFLRKIKNGCKDAISIERSILYVLNFYALMGLLAQHGHLAEDILLEYFGSAISHKVRDWKAFIEYLEKDKDYKKMIGHVKYIYKRAQERNPDVVHCMENLEG